MEYVGSTFWLYIELEFWQPQGSLKVPEMHDWLHLHLVLVTLVVLMRWWRQNHGKYLCFILVKFYLSESGGRAHPRWSGSVMEVDQPLCGGGLVRAPLHSSAGHLLQPAQAPPDHYITSHGADHQTCRKHQLWRFMNTVLGWNMTLSLLELRRKNPPGKSNPDQSTTLTCVIRD